MKKLNKLFFVFVLISFLFSCEKVTLEPESFDFNQPVSFQDDVVPIFEEKCVACHNGSREPDLRTDDAYQTLIEDNYINMSDPEMSEIYTILLGSHDSRATDLEKNTILAWIKQGADND